MVMRYQRVSVVKKQEARIKELEDALKRAIATGEELERRCNLALKHINTAYKALKGRE